MRYFEKLQHNLIAYRDALSGDWEISDSSVEDIEKLENTILESRPAVYRYITDRITSLIEYVRDMRRRQNAVDIDYVAESIAEIYYMCGIADQGASSTAMDNYKQPAMYVPKMPQAHALVKQPGQEIKPEKAPVKPKEIIKIANMPRGARYIFENNPFCVLGISASSSRADALKIRDKLQKLDHLGAADSYASPFDLANVEKPNRELGRLQVVLENINDLKHRWLWFREAGFYVSMWDSFKRYHHTGEGFDYNRLIAVYFCLLITDAQMAQTYYWDTLFDAVDSLCKKDDHALFEIITGSLHETIVEKYNYHMIAASFRESILVPVIMNIEAAPGTSLLAMLTYFKTTKYTFSADLIQKATEGAFTWALSRVDTVKSAMPAGPANAPLTKTQVDAVEFALDVYFAIEFATVQAVASALAGQELYTERINDRIRTVVWDATNILTRGGRKAKACKFDCLIYPFCTENQQKEIKRFYPYEMQSLPDSAYTLAECQEAAKKFGDKKDQRNRFIWLLKAAEKGDAGSQNDVGVAYALGQGVPKDPRKAVEWYEKAAAQGNAYALSNLANRYYYGTDFCKKDAEKARDYWIRAVVALRRKDDIDHLNSKFPGWQTSNHPRLAFTEHDWEFRLRPMAELGVPSAEFWYGHHLLRGEKGCPKDQKAARRWLLLASAHGFSKASITLEIWFEINVQEAITPLQMFNCGVKYAKLTGDQNADLAFYWYYRAYYAGYKDAANNLGVCYADGKGTTRNYDAANKLYLVGISQNNSGSYYNYGYNLYHGNGVAADKMKSRQHMMKAAELGFDSAKTFLREQFGVVYSNYQSFECVWFERREGISLSFDKLEVVPEGIKLTFWGKNTNDTARAFWIEYYTVDGERTTEWKKLIELEPNQCSYFSFIINGKQKADRIALAIEIDHNSTKKLFSYPELVIMLNNNTGAITPYISTTPSQQPPAEDDDDDEDDEELDEFEDISFTLYDEGNLHIEFCNFEVEGDTVYMAFWVNNKSSRDYKFWAMNVHVDGDRECHLELMGIAKAGKAEWCRIKLNSVSPEGYYTVDCYIEIDDLNNNKLACTPRISVEVDFDDYTLTAELIDEYEEDDEDEDEEIEFEDIEFVAYDDNDVYVEFCNFEVEDDTAFFSFWVRNNSNRTVHVYAQDIYVDGEKASNYMHIGEFKPNDCRHGRFTIPEVTPDTYYSISTHVEIDDENYIYVDSGDDFSISVDFEDGTLSAEME